MVWCYDVRLDSNGVVFDICLNSPGYDIRLDFHVVVL